MMSPNRAADERIRQCARCDPEADDEHGGKCDRCGEQIGGVAQHYGHGRVCDRCDMEMHSAYLVHGVRGYPAHQLETPPGDEGDPGGADGAQNER
jgi:hypothetical protein